MITNDFCLSEKEKLLKPCLNLLNSPLSNNFDIPKLIGLIPKYLMIKIFFIVYVILLLFPNLI